MALTCVILSPTGRAGPEQVWITQLGTSDGDSARALAPDSRGGVFIAGMTEGGLGGPWEGDQDAWFACYDEDGARRWIAQLGTSAIDEAHALAADGAGGIFIAGRTSGVLSGPGFGWLDAWLARYDGDGVRLWITQFGTPQGTEARALATDGAGGVFVAGHTSGSLAGPSEGSYDCWLARYDASGERLWLVQFGTDRNEVATSLAADGHGGVFAAGYTSGSLGGSSSGGNDIWLARYSTDGARRWIIQFGSGSDGDDEAMALAPDATGGVLIAGSARGLPGLPYADGQDAFVGRYTGDGARVWMTQFGTRNTDVATALAPDGSGGTIVVGYTSGSLGGPITGAPFDYDPWVARYSALGERLWMMQFGSASRDYAYTAAVDGEARIFIGGMTQGDLGGVTAGGDDAWIARLQEVSPCYADCDRSGALDFFDFLCFQNLFSTGDPAADCDADGELTFFDFLCFQNAFSAGCP